MWAGDKETPVYKASAVGESIAIGRVNEALDIVDDRAMVATVLMFNDDFTVPVEKISLDKSAFAATARTSNILGNYF